MSKLQYYSHLMLNSRYSLLIKLVIIFSIYILFYLDSSADIAYCTKSKAVNLKKQNTELQHEIFALKNELTRFRMSVDPNSYRELDTLETLKERIASYRERHAEGFITGEETQLSRHVRHIGANRPDLKFPPSFYSATKFVDVTSSKIHPHAFDHLVIDSMTIDDTGKQELELHRHYRLNREKKGAYSEFFVANDNLFYDFTERFEEVYYPANHPDNNFDPQFKRLRKLVEREFYAKQLPDQISENCTIS